MLGATKNSVFGRVEAVFFGDFAQLPPVEANNQENGKFYNSEIFQRATKFVLKKHIRQTDPVFISILSQVRLYQFNNTVCDFIMCRMVPYNHIPHNVFKLFAKHDRVDAANLQALEQHPGDTYELMVEDYFTGEPLAAQSGLRKTNILRKLNVKIGIPFLLIHNYDVRSSYTNGAILKLLDIDGRRLKVKLESTGAIRWLGTITQNVPFSSFKKTQYLVTLAFASTIHKVQILTLEAAAIHFSDFPSHGLLYVVMSRVKERKIYSFLVSTWKKEVSLI
jgi:hypothetical protein